MHVAVMRCSRVCRAVMSSWPCHARSAEGKKKEKGNLTRFEHATQGLSPFKATAMSRRSSPNDLLADLDDLEVDPAGDGFRPYWSCPLSSCFCDSFSYRDGEPSDCNVRHR